MGTFGHKIFQDDFALDIRDMYLEKLFDGQANENATDELILENQHADSDEEPVFWLSLAATQWEYGRLLEKVKEKAIEVIDSGRDLIKWDGDKKRYQELQRLKNKLLAEQPKIKKLVNRKPKINSGDVLVFKLDTTAFAYGRVLKEGYIAIYLFKSDNNKLPIHEVTENKVAFVIGTTDDGFYSRKWKVIGNLPLEESFKQPIYFFHIAVMSKECRVFDIWDNGGKYNIIDEVKCKTMEWGPLGIEQWEAYSTPHIIQRLTAKLEGKPYLKGFLPDDWEDLHFRRSFVPRSQPK